MRGEACWLLGPAKEKLPHLMACSWLLSHLERRDAIMNGVNNLRLSGVRQKEQISSGGHFFLAGDSLQPFAQRTVPVGRDNAAPQSKLMFTFELIDGS